MAGGTRKAQQQAAKKLDWTTPRHAAAAYRKAPSPGAAGRKELRILAKRHTQIPMLGTEGGPYGTLRPLARVSVPW